MCSSEDHSHRRGQWGHCVGLVSTVFLELPADRAPASYSADRSTQTLPHGILYTDFITLNVPVSALAWRWAPGVTVKKSPHSIA